MDHVQAAAAFRQLVAAALERNKATYDVYPIERLPAPGERLENDPERATLSFRATFAPTRLMIEWSCGSAIPLRAYCERPLSWSINHFIGTGHTGRDDILRAAKIQGRGISKHDAAIRQVIRRHYRPLPEDVLQSAVSDYTIGDSVRSFEDWIDELCLEPPRPGRVAEWLRYWRGNFDRWVATEGPLKAFFGEDWSKALELVQGM